MADVNPRRVVLVHDMDRSKAAGLAKRMSGLFQHCQVTVCDEVVGALANADGLVHATPTGMQKYPGIPLRADCLRPPLWVADIVYVPLLTELFFGVNPDVARMQRRFHSKLATAAA